jgi:hypothetical protein
LINSKCVHTEHCCTFHGCKYGDDDCPVYLGLKRQSYPCENCREEIYLADKTELPKQFHDFAFKVFGREESPYYKECVTRFLPALAKYSKCVIREYLAGLVKEQGELHD